MGIHKKYFMSRRIQLCSSFPGVKTCRQRRFLFTFLQYLIIIQRKFKFSEHQNCRLKLSIQNHFKTVTKYFKFRLQFDRKSEVDTSTKSVAYIKCYGEAFGIAQPLCIKMSVLPLFFCQRTLGGSRKVTSVLQFMVTSRPTVITIDPLNLQDSTRRSPVRGI